MDENWPTQEPTISFEMEVQAAQTEAAQSGFLKLSINESSLNQC